MNLYGDGCLPNIKLLNRSELWKMKHRPEGVHIAGVCVQRAKQFTFCFVFKRSWRRLSAGKPDAHPKCIRDFSQTIKRLLE